MTTGNIMNNYGKWTVKSQPAPSRQTSRGLPTFETAGQGAAASLEGGYPFSFAGGYFIEPQAQLVFQNIHINDANDIAAQIRFADVNSLAGRIGARFGRTWAIDDSPRTITAWIRPNLWNEFQGNPTTSFSSATGFVCGLWGEINAGISGQVTSTTTLYANASYQSRFDGGGFAYNGKVDCGSIGKDLYGHGRPVSTA
jgi:outer membrane autotransporter protein